MIAIVWSHNTWLLADDKLYRSEQEAAEAIKTWLSNDPKQYKFRRLFNA